MKTAIVSGATGNLGQAVVKKFFNAGYKVTGTIIPNDPVKLDYPADKFNAVEVDLMNEEATAKFIFEVISNEGSIDIAVLTVGGFAMGSVAETSTADIEKQYKLNFETTYNIARPVFTQMVKQNKGRIFFIGSKPGLNAANGKGMVAYSLGKSLVFHLAELMNDEAKGHNVVISVVVPGTIDTLQNRKAMPDANSSDWVKPEAIADIIYYYSTDAAASIREPVIKLYNNS
jgi:NAD(P)-dependent dehydrogenase (short-subunit alcohol dehydrogenase family)